MGNEAKGDGIGRRFRAHSLLVKSHRSDAMEQSPSFEANRFAASQKIPRIFIVSEEHRNSSPR
jgi:hypothetical protein